MNNSHLQCRPFWIAAIMRMGPHHFEISVPKLSCIPIFMILSLIKFEQFDPLTSELRRLSCIANSCSPGQNIIWVLIVFKISRLAFHIQNMHRIENLYYITQSYIKLYICSITNNFLTKSLKS